MKNTETKTNATEETAMTNEVKRWKIHSEWLLLLRKQQIIQENYDRVLNELNTQTEKALEPIINRINELDAEEKAILKEMEEKDEHLKNGDAVGGGA